jgi:hypothetical protein
MNCVALIVRLLFDSHGARVSGAETQSITVGRAVIDICRQLLDISRQPPVRFDRT